MMDFSTLRFDEHGLIPGIVQAPSGEVRMMGWLNAEALEKTLETGYVTFWSRSRHELWTKGGTSGNRLQLISLRPDCDGDTLLLLAEPEGPTCHRGTDTCFDTESSPAAHGLPWLGRLEALLETRRATAKPDGSYTQKLFAAGVDRIGKKVVEEAGEVVIAAKNLGSEPDEDTALAFLNEAADLLFHLDMLLLQAGMSLSDVAEVLRQRHAGAPLAAPDVPGV